MIGTLVIKGLILLKTRYIPQYGNELFYGDADRLFLQTTGSYRS